MMNYLALNGALFTLLKLIYINAIDFKLVFDDEQVIKPCEGEEDIFISNWLDMSNVTYEFLDDDEIIINGDYIGICPAPKTAIPSLDVRLYKMIRGAYRLALLQIRRNNMCKALFSPLEFWYHYMNEIEMQYRTCPSVPGSIYPFRNYSTKNNIISLPDPNLAGGYRVVARSFFKDNSGPPFCFVADLHLYRN